MISDAEILPWFQVVFYTVASIGVVISYFTFRANQKVKRGEWLKSLFEKFFESEGFKVIRKKIESGELDRQLRNGSLTVTDQEEKLTDYLNFFEFIAYLESDDQLKTDDVKNLFDYQLRKLKSSSVCIEWIENKEYSFEKLRNLLSRLYPDGS